MTPMAKVKAGAAIIIALASLFLLVRLGPFRFGLLVAAVLLVTLGLWAAKWAFVPRGELPRNRVRYQRIRLYLRLHPGRGHATWWELHRQWSRTAAYRRVSRVRSS
jgi:hypothetical protein